MTKKQREKRKGRFGGFLKLIIAVITVIAIFAMLSVAVTPARYDIQVGQPAPNTIKASKDVVDRITTEKLKSEAAAAVKSMYSFDEGAAEEVKEQLTEAFKSFRGLSSLVTVEENTEFTEEQLEAANAGIPDIDLTVDEIKALCMADADALSSLSERAVACVEEAMNDRLSEKAVEEKVGKIREQLLTEGFDEKLVSVAMTAVNTYIRPNYFYDEAATEAARQAEKDKVAVVSRIKGEVIVSDGELVTEAQYVMLDALGIVKQSTVDIWLYVGLGLLLIISMLAVALFLFLFEKSVYSSPRKLLMISIICILTMGFCMLAREVDTYAMPVTLAVLMIALLIDRRTALFISIPLSVLISMLASATGSFFNMANYTIIISSLVSGIVELWILKFRQTRVSVLLAGVAAGVCNIVITFTVGLISSSGLTSALYPALISSVSGVLAAVLCIALTPAFEGIFNCVTTTRMVELSNPNQPLLRRLMLEAPGTYHHSIIVANLAEAAADAIGANGMLARVGAYYHDIGKIKRPNYFKENQMGDNPHDRTDPRVSTAIITAHPREGLQLLRESRIPDEIRNIVLTHHGDTPVIYFYNKALTDKGEADINDFRYPGPRPNTREEAVVMLADTVEAAARAMTDPTPEKMRELIHKLIRGKIEDGQLDDCSLTFADISLIESSFVTVLSGAFHERIEYPTIEIPKKHAETEEQKVDS